jgi:hypothetical protein
MFNKTERSNAGVCLEVTLAGVAHTHEQLFGSHS